MKIKPAVARESRDQEMNGAVNPSLAAQRPVSRGPIPTPQEKAAVSREILKV
tara:strand:+ start:509 stop:664 length:156 start_codon:yes stop_codon:yes gene_type:complete